jgi:hypothetical protein
MKDKICREEKYLPMKWSSLKCQPFFKTNLLLRNYNSALKMVN